MNWADAAAGFRGTPDYQDFDATIRKGALLFKEALDLSQPGLRMKQKLAAIPLPDLAGKSVLDVGCDAGFFCWLALSRGAARVLGVDRGREVAGVGFVDLAARNREIAAGLVNADRLNDAKPRCEFVAYDIGRQWPDLGGGEHSGAHVCTGAGSGLPRGFDVVLALSVYHHIYPAVRDHRPIWTWLARQVAADGVLLWEGPVDARDSAVRMHLGAAAGEFNREAILAAAGRWFNVEHVGPALHRPHREVWRCRPRSVAGLQVRAHVVPGSGHASAAFELDNGRRCREIEQILGYRPYPGTLNLRLPCAFDWEAHGFVSAALMDAVDRADPRSIWALRRARFYPCTVDGLPGHVIHFDADRQHPHLVGVIAPQRLRGRVNLEVTFTC